MSAVPEGSLSAPDDYAVSRRTAASTRERISVAAFDLLADKGYEAASVAAIAKHAGVSTGSVYQHFADKREILDSAFDDAVAAMTAALDPDAVLLSAPDDWQTAIDLLMAAARRGLRFLNKEPRIVKFITAQASSTDIDIRQRVLGLEAMINSRFVKNFHKAVDSGWIHADPDVAGIVVRSTIAYGIPFLLATLSGDFSEGRADALFATAEKIARRGILATFGTPELEAMNRVLDSSELVESRVEAVISYPSSRRWLLLDAAVELYAARGYRGVKPADIVNHAGLGYGTFYNYFANRRECLQQVLERELTYMWSILDLMRPTPRTSAELIAELTRIALRVAMYAEKRGRYVVTTMLDSIGIDHEATELLTSAFTRLAQLIADYLHRCPAGVLREDLDLELAAQFIVSALGAICLHRVQEAPRAVSVKLMTVAIVRALCRGAEQRV